MFDTIRWRGHRYGGGHALLDAPRDARHFGGGGASAPPPPPPPPPPRPAPEPPPPPSEDPEAKRKRDEAAAKEKQRLQVKRGSSRTIATSPLGVLGAAPTNTPALKSTLGG